MLMTKGQSSAFVVELLEHTTDFSPERSAAPANTEKQLNENGIYDYFEEARTSTTKDWKKKVGEFAMREIVKAEMSRTGRECEPFLFNNISCVSLVLTY